jgi:hypothetical protein
MRTNRILLILATTLLAFSLGQSARADLPGPPPVVSEPPAARLPLRILEARQLPAAAEGQKGLPLVTVAAMPEGEKETPLSFADAGPAAPSQIMLAPTTEKAPLLDAFAVGKLNLAGPRADTETVMFLVGPELNTGEKWGPAEITLDERTKAITLVVESWTDSGPRRRNVLSRDAYLISLGKLNPAEYVFRVVSRHYHAEAGPLQPHALKGLGNAVDKFRVASAKDAAKSQVFTFWPADLEAAEVPDETKKLLWQVPAYSWLHLAPTDLLKAAGRVKVGQFDPDKVEAFLTLNTKSVAGSPDVINPKDNRPAQVTILGPLMNTGEWLTLREVIWSGNKMTVKVDLWRDNGERAKNILFYPVLVVPVTPPGKLAKFDVTVEWNTLVAPQSDGLYQPTPRAEAVSTAHVETMAMEK